MTCIRTGCVAYLRQYGEWVYGDAFTYGGYLGDPENTGILCLRLVWKGHKSEELAQFGNVRHFTVDHIVDWWDEDRTSMKQNSTLLAPPRGWINHGYDGIPEPKLQKE